MLMELIDQQIEGGCIRNLEGVYHDHWCARSVVFEVDATSNIIACDVEIWVPENQTGSDVNFLIRVNNVEPFRFKLKRNVVTRVQSFMPIQAGTRAHVTVICDNVLENKEDIRDLSFVTNKFELIPAEVQNHQ